MKCNEAEKLILLQDSGEIAKKQTEVLAAHLQNCDPCQGFRHTLLESRNTFQTVEEPPAAVLNNIKREARWLAPEKTAKTFVLKPAFALAASILIGLGIFFTAIRYNTVGLELVMTETELLDAPDQIVSVMYDGLTEDDLAFNFLMTYEEEG